MYDKMNDYQHTNQTLTEWRQFMIFHKFSQDRDKSYRTEKKYTNHNRPRIRTNQIRVDQSQPTGSSDQSEQCRQITTNWIIWPIRAG